MATYLMYPPLPNKNSKSWPMILRSLNKSQAIWTRSKSYYQRSKHNTIPTFAARETQFNTFWPLRSCKKDKMARLKWLNMRIKVCMSWEMNIGRKWTSCWNWTGGWLIIWMLSLRLWWGRGLNDVRKWEKKTIEFLYFCNWYSTDWGIWFYCKGMVLRIFLFFWMKSLYSIVIVHFILFFIGFICMLDWIKSKTNQYRKDYGKYNFHLKSEP